MMWDDDIHQDYREEEIEAEEEEQNGRTNTAGANPLWKDESLFSQPTPNVSTYDWNTLNVSASAPPHLEYLHKQLFFIYLFFSKTRQLSLPCDPQPKSGFTNKPVQGTIMRYPLMLRDTS